MARPEVKTTLAGSDELGASRRSDLVAVTECGYRGVAMTTPEFSQRCEANARWPVIFDSHVPAGDRANGLHGRDSRRDDPRRATPGH